MSPHFQKVSAAVHWAAMTHAHDGHENSFTIEPVDDTVAPDPQSPEPLPLSGQHTAGQRVALQAFDGSNDPFLRFSRKRPKLLHGSAFPEDR